MRMVGKEWFAGGVGWMRPAKYRRYARRQRSLWVQDKCRKIRTMIYKHMADKDAVLSILRQATEIVAPGKYGSIEYMKVRSDFRARPWQRHPCAACGVRQNLHLHHIITILNGGVNTKTNLISVCKDCHGSIHGFPVGDEYGTDAKVYNPKPFPSIRHLNPDSEQVAIRMPQDVPGAVSPFEIGRKLREVKAELLRKKRQAI